MDNHPAVTKDYREFLSSISDDVYELSQDFQDYPEDSPEYSSAKQFLQAYRDLYNLLCSK